MFWQGRSEVVPQTALNETALYAMVNASAEVTTFHLPEPLAAAQWSHVLATGPIHTVNDGVEVETFSLAVFEAIVG
jgi:pullulanase/glycogen debranching enzyme